MLNKAKQKFTNLNFATKASFLVFLFTITTFSSLFIFVYQLDQKAVTEEAQKFDFPIAHSDSEGYAKIAKNIQNGNGFSINETSPYQAFTHWPPGYPYLLSFSFTIFDSPLPLIILQLLLSATTAVLIYQITRRFTSDKFALIPAIIFALDISIGYYTISAYTDGLYMSLITVLIYILFFTDHEKLTPLKYLSLGFLLGFSALVRTVSQYLIPVLPIVFLTYVFFKKDNLKNATLGMFMLVVGAISVISPWLARNHAIVGSYDLGTNGPSMLLEYYVKDFLTLKFSEETSEDFAQSETAEEIDEMLQKEVAKLVEEKGGTPLSHYKEVALSHIFEQPFSYTKFHTIGTVPYFLAGSYRHFFVSILGKFQDQADLPRIEHKNIAHQMTEALYKGDISHILNTIASLSFVLFEVAWRILLLMLAIVPLLTKHKQKILFITMWLFILYFAFITGPSSLTRYRLVTEPLLLSLAAIGLWQVLSLKLKNVRNKK